MMTASVQTLPTTLQGVLLLQPRVFRDYRGFFLESYSQTAMTQAGLPLSFPQDNHSRSSRGVIRGLHYQLPPHAQGKLVRVVRGEIFDVAVDLRRNSPTLGRWFGTRLSEENLRMLWIPAGFAHGFLVLSEVADLLYKTTDYYAPDCERTILWNDPNVGIEWPLTGTPRLSPKDAAGKPFREAEVFTSPFFDSKATDAST